MIALDTGPSLTSLAAELRAEPHQSSARPARQPSRAGCSGPSYPGRWRGYPKHRAARALLIHGKRDLYRDHRPVAERYFSAARELTSAPDGGPPEFFLGPEAEQRPGLAGGSGLRVQSAP